MVRSTWKLVALLAMLPFTADSAETVSAEDYLKEVRAKNQEVQGAIVASEGSLKRSGEASLTTSFVLFSDGEFASDAMLPLVPLFSYDRVETTRFNLGVRKLTTFGMEAKAYYRLTHTNYVNMSLPPGVNYYDARPVIELTQSLWANGFGRATRAQRDAGEAQALAVSFNNRHKARSLLVAAEDAYWRLALARDRVDVTKKSLEQAQKLYKWSAGRVRRNLADEADALQAKAALELRQLEMQSAVDEENAAARLFNRLRNSPENEVPQELESPTSEQLLAKLLSQPKPHRDDVKAAEQQQRATVAAAAASMEKNRPLFDVYGSYGFNGRDAQLAAALGNPFTANRPAFSLGLRFSMPLDRGTASNVVDGFRQEQIGAEISYQQKLADQKREWDDLIQRIKESKARLKLHQAISQAQKAKLKVERERLSSGRSTTFQVLIFEQDFAQSQLAEIGARAELLRALTQTKLYGGPL